jgi:hypothetical protein
VVIINEGPGTEETINSNVGSGIWKLNDIYDAWL